MFRLSGNLRRNVIDRMLRNPISSLKCCHTRLLRKTVVNNCWHKVVRNTAVWKNNHLLGTKTISYAAKRREMDLA
jgi:hypothetical protein